MFVFFLLCGRYLEMRARQKAAASLEYLDRAIPLAAHRLKRYPASHDTEEVPAVSLARGDLVLVKPGEVVPADGVLVAGETETDESLLTGESRPALKRVGAQLVAGSVNRLSPAVLRVEQVGEATRASHIRRLTRTRRERAAPARDGHRPDRRLVRRRRAADCGRGRRCLGRRRPCPRAVDRRGGAGRHLPVRSVAGHADRAGRVGRQAGAARRGGHARPRDRSAVARDARGIRQDRHADRGDAHVGRRSSRLAMHRAPQVLALAAALEQGSEHPIARAVLERGASRERVGAAG